MLDVAIGKGFRTIDRVDPDRYVFSQELFCVSTSCEIDGGRFLIHDLGQPLFVLLSLLASTFSGLLE